MAKHNNINVGTIAMVAIPITIVTAIGALAVVTYKGYRMVAEYSYAHGSNGCWNEDDDDDCGDENGEMGVFEYIFSTTSSRRK